MGVVTDSLKSAKENKNYMRAVSVSATEVTPRDRKVVDNTSVVSESIVNGILHRIEMFRSGGRFLHVIYAFPGSGKSSFRNRIDGLNGVEVIDTDDYRSEDHVTGDCEGVREATLLLALLTGLQCEGKVFVLSSVCPRSMQRLIDVHIIRALPDLSGGEVADEAWKRRLQCHDSAWWKSAHNAAKSRCPDALNCSVSEWYSQSIRNEKERIFGESDEEDDNE